MRVLFCTTGGLGHLLPLRPLADALRQRGHAVAWVTAPDALGLLKHRGFDLFAAGPTFELGRQQFRTAHTEGRGLRGEQLSAYTFPRLFGDVLAPAMLEGVELAARRWRADVVVHEPAALVAPLVCRRLGLRQVTHGYGLQPPNRYLDEATAYLERCHVGSGAHPTRAEGRDRRLQMDITPRSLQACSQCPDEDAIRFNVHTRGTSPLPLLPADLHAALRPRPGRPRIYVTFGTVFNRSPSLLVAAQAAEDMGATVVVTAGIDGDLQSLARLGSHVHAHGFLDQAALLSHCDAVVSHGGAGTMLGAAAHGLPHLVLPQAADHFRNGRAITAAGAGRVVEPELQIVEEVAARLADVMTSSAMRGGAQAIAREMAAMPDAVAAACSVEYRLASS